MTRKKNKPKAAIQKPRRVSFYVPIYKRRVLIQAGGTMESACLWAAKRCGYEPDPTDWHGATKQTKARTFTKNGEPVVVWMSTTHIANLSHELVHAAVEILRTAGVPPGTDWGNEEALAYLLEYLFCQVAYLRL